ncbi:MFS transporter [Pseudarthrobacter sp. O4]|uniref:MFS transporter n=1 Tax=Pseudarthrobacter sp. O4 TaxID=3418417 RepID=UPI003CF551C1
MNRTVLAEDGTARRSTQGKNGRAFAVIALLAASTFMFITVENMPIGLLTLMAPSFETTPAMIGLLVTGYAVIVSLSSIPLTKLSMGIPRRRLLCSAIALLVLATLSTAFAPNYYFLLGGRILGALAHAVFWSIVATTAVSLFDRPKHGTVISIVFAGSSLGTVLGIPAVVWIANQQGWRLTFLLMSALGVCIFVLLSILLPGGSRDDEATSSGSTPDGRTFHVILLTAAVGVSGIFIAQTYITLFLTEATGLRTSELSLALLAAGITGVLGVFMGGWLAPRMPNAAIAGPLALISAAMFCAYAAAASAMLVVVMFAVVALGFTAFAAAVQVRVLVVAPGSTDIASAASSTMFNIGIGSGALIGGAVVEILDVRTTALASGSLAAIAVLVFLLGLSPAAQRQVGIRMRNLKKAPLEPGNMQ